MHQEQGNRGCREFPNPKIPQIPSGNTRVPHPTPESQNSCWECWNVPPHSQIPKFPKFPLGTLESLTPFANPRDPRIPVGNMGVPHPIPQIPAGNTGVPHPIPKSQGSQNSPKFLKFPLGIPESPAPGSVSVGFCCSWAEMRSWICRNFRNCFPSFQGFVGFKGVYFPTSGKIPNSAPAHPKQTQKLSGRGKSWE